MRKISIFFCLATAPLSTLAQPAEDITNVDVQLEGVIQGEANEESIKNLDLPKFSTIAFATHGLLSGDLPGLEEPSLLLTPPRLATDLDDGLLSTTEIASLNLNADLVILSACNTYYDDAMTDIGISGISSAFLEAGARNLLVPHWAVDSNVASFVTTATIEAFDAAPELGFATALRTAIELVREQPGWDHPAFWAAFSVVGANY